MSRITIFILIVFSLLVAACSGLLGEDQPDTSPAVLTPGEPYPAPWEPKEGDEQLSQGEVSLTKQDLRVQESYPPQYVLSIAGTLPTPCHQLRVTVSEADENNQIHVEVYSVVDPVEICIQVLEPFEANIPLGSFSSGEYTVLVNDQPAGEIAP